MRINKYIQTKKPYIPPIISLEDIEDDGALMNESGNFNVDPAPPGEGSQRPGEWDPFNHAKSTEGDFIFNVEDTGE